MKLIFSFVIYFYLGIFILTHFSYAHTCQPKLWPTSSFTNHSLQQQAIKIISPLAQKALLMRSTSIAHLASAGKINANDPTLLASRRAMREADNAVILALMYQLTHDQRYLNAARQILMIWATINHPTGHPIDETRLAGLVWAYDLVNCQLTTTDKNKIMTWFQEMKNKKLAWKFKKTTLVNNHQTHHLKMLLLLNKILNSPDWHKTLTHAIDHSKLNLNTQTGESFDYKNRSALFYHNYDLQAWLEIILITQQPIPAVTKAYTFLTEHIHSHQTQHEFLYSQAKIDMLREKGGFTYAKMDGEFDIQHAIPTVLAYSTQCCEEIPLYFKPLISKAKASPWLAFLKARKILWRCHKNFS